MSQTRSAPVAVRLHRLLDAQRQDTVREWTDAQLLQRFAATGEEDAFATLLRRHAALVISVCRRVLHNEHDAEDAFQATFLMLARHAGSIRATEALASWLYRVAYRAATRAGLAAARRIRREQSARPEQETQCSPATEAALHELQRVLDEEVNRLPEKYQAPFVLCCLEGKTRGEAARDLGWKEGTVAGRLALARQMLQHRLSRRGITLAAALTVLGLTAPAETVVGAELQRSTIKTALIYAAGQTSGVPAAVACLLKGVCETMLWTKTKVAVILLAALGLVVAGSAAKPQGEIEAKQAAKQAALPAAPKEAEKPKPATSDDKDSVTYGGHVLDAEGKPVVGAKLYALYYTPKALPVPARATSDKDGAFRFSIAKADFDRSTAAEPWGQTTVVAVAEGHGLGLPPFETGRRWDPANQTLLCPKDDAPISGRILDLQGKPIAGVSVVVQGLYWPRKGDLAPCLKAFKEGKIFYPPVRDFLTGFEGPQIGPALAQLFPSIVTGADGRFTIKRIGRERLPALRIEGPTVASREIFVATRPDDSGKPIEVPGSWSQKDGDEVRLVYGASFDHAAAPCKPIVGVVRDKDTGKPIAGAVVTSYMVAGSNFGERTHIRTVADKDGKYRLLGMPKGDGNVIRAAPPEDQPYLMSSARIADSPGLEPVTVDIELKRGVWINGKVTDKTTGKPVFAHYEYVVFEDNPNRKDVPNLSTHSYLYSSPVDGTFRTVGLPGRGLVGARAAGGDRYRMAVGADKLKGKDGLIRTYPHFVFARNFHTLVEVNPARGADGVAVDVVLDPGLTLTGTVLDPDGKPLAGALMSGVDSYGSWGYEPLKPAEFTVLGLEPGESRLLQVFHKEKNLAGSLVIKAEQKERPTIKLVQAATLTGRLVTPEGKPANDGEVISLQAPPMAAPGDAKPDLTVGSFHENRVRPAKDGTFRIDGLVPGLKYNMGVIKGFYLHRLGGDAGGTLILKTGETKKLGDVEVKPFE
jgi:RNA polymerase sigma factor (sigma-70 family)